jgi:hypothetical protein
MIYIRTTCDECGNEVDFDTRYLRAEVEIIVKPCNNCLDEAYHKGREEGDYVCSITSG